MKLIAAALVLFSPAMAFAVVNRNPGSAAPIPHDKYVRVVSEADAPVQQTYIRTKDGLYVAAAIRKPKGDGPFPAIIIFHGAPGGRGMEQLVGWSRGDHGGPVWERFLQEGFVVVVGDYRGGDWNAVSAPSETHVTSIDDGISVVEYVRSLPYVDRSRVSLYGVSLGGNLVMYLVSRVPDIHRAVLGAPAPFWFLGIRRPPPGTALPDPPPADPAVAGPNIEPIRTPLLILVGTADRLLGIATTLHDELERAGKQVRMEVYEHGYHDFVLGPQGQKRPDLAHGEVLLDSTLDALEKTVAFVKGSE
ncbi:MAG TPA: alpha/beta fold hydrolase [Vicinamibacterales bacterium]|nr:alpha/beta fold hydrolase [Vicinamibacterales bacterium]